jgi:glycine amidinotransferase
MSSADTSLRAPARVRVDYEYGTLREVIVGRPEGFRLPTLSPVALAEYAQILPPADVEFLTRGQGRSLVEYAPDAAAELASQVEQLVRILHTRGVIVHRPRPLTAAEQLFPGSGPAGGSLFFMRDPILVIGSRIIDLAMRFDFRRRQRFALREIIEERSAADDVQFLSMPEPVPVAPEQAVGAGAFLEGGDVLLNGNEIYVGVSGHASSAAGALWLRKLVAGDAKVYVVKLADSILHLDCALSIPRPGLVIACLQALPEGLPGVLRGWDLIDVTYEEARRLACNGLILDADTYVMDRTHRRVAEELKRRNVNVITTPFELPARFGGGLRCTHHPLVRD